MFLLLLWWWLFVNKIIIYMLEFVKIGALAFGGGLATIPFLKEFGANYNLFGLDFLIRMIAVSESTPGPIGINMASFIGFNTLGIYGAILFSLALVFPSVVVVLIISKYIKNIDRSPKVQKVLSFLRPSTIALITSVLLPIIRISFYKEGFLTLNAVIAVVVFYFYRKFKIHPIVVICCCAILGIIFKL